MPPKFVNEIDFTKMTFSAPFPNHNGGSSAFPNMGPASERVKVEFQMHGRERAPFGVNKTDPNGNPVTARFNFALAVDNESNREGLEKFDTQVVKFFHENAKIFWPKKKKVSYEDVKRMYRPILAEASDPDKYAPLVRLKVHADPENPAGRTSIYVVTKDADGTETYDPDGTIDNITRNAEVTVIVRATVAWMLGGGIQFGVSLKVTKALVYPQQNLEEEFPFIMPAGVAPPTKNARTTMPPPSLPATGGEFNNASESVTTAGLAAALSAAGVIPGAGAGAPAPPPPPPPPPPPNPLKRQRTMAHGVAAKN
jgi:hypothetical protein